MTLYRGLLLAAWAAIVAAAVESISRQLARVHLLGWLPDDPGWLAVVPLAALALVAVALSIAGRHSPRPRWTVTAVVFGALFAAGLAVQLKMGARLQSDGFYYYAYLRSLAFDRDVNFLNDYRMLGQQDKPHLFEPTITGHAPSAWTIGPAIVWSPFFAAGHLAATGLAARGAPVATDGTSYPYRQAICIAGLTYALLGTWFAFRAARRLFDSRTAAVAVTMTIGGSFLLWYALVEPTMTHAPSMAAVAGFFWYWIATHGRRSLRGWIVLGALAGLATLIRWQNALFALLPLCELANTGWIGPSVTDVPIRRVQYVARNFSSAIAAFAAAATIVFLPQMLAWKAIYGSYLAVSPLGPDIRWFDPHLVDVLFSSRNGLFAMSPALYIAALGAVVLAWRLPTIGVPVVIAIAAMTYFNSCIQDWWGSDGFGGRRFDGVVALLVPGAAIAFDLAREVVKRRPAIVVGAVLAALAAWNLTFMRAAGRGEVRIGEAIEFRRVSGAQARTLHDWIGHPAAYPASLWFAANNGLRPADYDVLSPLRFLADPARPYGRIDVGTDDAVFIRDGWHAPERDGDLSFRWASRSVVLLVPLDHAAALDVQVRARAYSYPNAPAQLMTIDTSRGRSGPMPVGAAWETVTLPTPEHAWRAGVVRLRLEFARETRPRDVGAGGDDRPLAAAIDWVRVMKRPGT